MIVLYRMLSVRVHVHWQLCYHSNLMNDTKHAIVQDIRDRDSYNVLRRQVSTDCECDQGPPGPPGRRGRRG